MPTKQLTFRIPIEKHEKIKKRVARIAKIMAKEKGVRKMSRDEVMVILIENYNN